MTVQGGMLRSVDSSEKHLSVALIEAGIPNKHTLAKMHGLINEDLLGKNQYSQGKKEFLGVNTFRRLLNDAFDSKWSWELQQIVIMPTYEDPEYILVTGRLYLPGLGFRDGIGTAKLDKKDNSAAAAVAGSNAFKNALKQSGFGASVLDEDWDEELYDEDFEDDDEEEVEEEVAPPKKQKADKPKADKEEKEEKPKADKKKGSDITDEQKEAIAELKDIYNIKENKQLLGFMQIWDENLKSLSGMTSAQVDEFLDFYDENEELFEDFDPEEVE